MGSLWTEVQLLEPDHQLSPSAHAARSTIARIIANGGEVSRRQIVASTGLARSTVDGHLDVLLSAGLIEDAGTSLPPARGRPAQSFRINPRRGVVLVAEGFEYHVPKGFVYFAMAFSLSVELLNIRMRKRSATPVKLHPPHIPGD